MKTNSNNCEERWYLQPRYSDFVANSKGELAKAMQADIKYLPQTTKKAWKDFMNLVSLNKFQINKVNLLDAGCRNGHLYNYIKKEFPDLQYTGIDVVQNYIDDATIAQVNCYLMDWCDLKIFNDTFDIVFSHHSLEYVWNPIIALQETYRILKKEGVFFLVVPVENTKSVSVNNYGEITGEYMIDIKQCLTEIGFEITYECKVDRSYCEAHIIAHKQKKNEKP